MSTDRPESGRAQRRRGSTGEPSLRFFEPVGQSKLTSRISAEVDSAHTRTGIHIQVALNLRACALLSTDGLILARANLGLSVQQTAARGAVGRVGAHLAQLPVTLERVGRDCKDALAKRA